MGNLFTTHNNSGHNNRDNFEESSNTSSNISFSKSNDTFIEINNNYCNEDDNNIFDCNKFDEYSDCSDTFNIDDYFSTSPKNCKQNVHLQPQIFNTPSNSPLRDSIIPKYMDSHIIDLKSILQHSNDYHGPENLEDINNLISLMKNTNNGSLFDDNTTYENNKYYLVDNSNILSGGNISNEDLSKNISDNNNIFINAEEDIRNSANGLQKIKNYITKKGGSSKKETRHLPYFISSDAPFD